jgi:hypothetical protein
MKKHSRAKLESYFSTGDSDLLAYLEFDATSGDIQDLSGKGNDATITGTATVADETIGVASQFAGSSNYARILSATTDLAELTQNGQMAVSIWCKPTFTGGIQPAISQANGGGTGRTWISLYEPGGASGDEIATFLGGTALYSGVVAQINNWYHIVVNYIAGSPNGTLQVWVNGVMQANQAEDVRAIDEGADGDIHITTNKSISQYSGAHNHQMLIFDRSLKQAEIEALYNKGVVQFAGAYGAVETTSKTDGFLGDTPFLVDSGTFKVTTEKIGQELVKSFECEADGVVYLPLDSAGIRDAEGAYGTWEWWMNKGDTANVTEVLFCADTIGDSSAVGQDAYGIRFSNLETADLFESTNGSAATLFTTANDYIANNTWYGLKVTRDASGEITAYISGGAYGNDYTPILLVGGSGANPVTDTTITAGQYLVLSMKAGDKFGYGSNRAKYSFTKNLFKK